MKKDKKDKKQKPRKYLYVCPRCSTQFDTARRGKLPELCPVCDHKGFVREDKLVKVQAPRNVERHAAGPIGADPKDYPGVNNNRTRRGLK